MQRSAVLWTVFSLSFPRRFFEIKDFVESFPTKSSEEELVYEFLNHPNVMRVLAGLADSIEAVEDKIQNDARFKNLQPYTSLIIDAIKRASEKHVPQQVYYNYEKPPLWQMEYKEYKDSGVEPHISRAGAYARLYDEYKEVDTGYRIPVSYDIVNEKKSSRADMESVVSYTEQRVSRPKIETSTLSLTVYIILLIIIAYVFVEIPWITFYGEQYYIGSMKVTPIKMTSSGWDMTWFFIELWRVYDVRPPIFIVYFIGLLLAVIALITRSPTLSAVSSLAMLIGWYDFYKSATLIHKLYVQLVGVIGLVNIKYAELEMGVTLAGFLSFLHLVLGTYLIHKASKYY